MATVLTATIDNMLLQEAIRKFKASILYGYIQVYIAKSFYQYLHYLFHLWNLLMCTEN